MYPLDQQYTVVPETSTQGSGTITAPSLGHFRVKDTARENVESTEGPFNEENFRHKISVASRCYSEALIHFKKAKSPRGYAITALRQACVLTLDEMQISRCWGPHRYDSEIQCLLSVAQSSCLKVGDVQLSKLIQIHILLTRSPALRSLPQQMRLVDGRKRPRTRSSDSV